jgi:hypothetical protein
VTNDETQFRYRLRVMATAEELGNARPACRMFGIHQEFYSDPGQALCFIS